MLLASLLNDPLLTPDQKDYIYDFKEIAILLLAVVSLDGALKAYKHRFWNLLFARIVLSSTLFATWKEVFGGLNKSDSGTCIFVGMNLVAIAYTVVSWRMKRKKK